MKNLRFKFSGPVRILGLAAALSLAPMSASADTVYQVSESGVFASNAPITAESAPNATFTYSFLIDVAPAINFVTAYAGPDCGFDALFSDFSYTFNGTPLALTFPDVQFFGTSFGGGVDITPSYPVQTTPTTPYGAGNFDIFTADSAQFFTGTYENPTITPGTYLIDPTQSFFATDYVGSDGTAISGDIVIASPTPEPSSLVLLGTGLAGLGAAMRRKFRT